MNISGWIATIGNLDRCDWIANAGVSMGLLGIVIGCIIAARQRRESEAWEIGRRRESETRERKARKRGDELVAFLHGLKGETLTKPTIDQVNDMLARLDPPG
jgi:hypothetical protein